jgi:hypothetical protein
MRAVLNPLKACVGRRIRAFVCMNTGLKYFSEFFAEKDNPIDTKQ